MSLTFDLRHDASFSEINTTPLIDVMLVLLVMLILALPPATNTLSYPLPQSVTGLAPDALKNTVGVKADNKITWNGIPVSELELEATLARAVAIRPEPELLIEPDGPASYDESARVLRIVKDSGATNIGFAGNERYASFSTGGPADPTADAG